MGIPMLIMQFAFFVSVGNDFTIFSRESILVSNWRKTSLTSVAVDCCSWGSSWSDNSWPPHCCEISAVMSLNKSGTVVTEKLCRLPSCAFTPSACSSNTFNRLNLKLCSACSIIFLVLAGLARAPPTTRIIVIQGLLLPFPGCVARALAGMSLIAHMTAVMRRQTVKEANLTVRMATCTLYIHIVPSES